MTTVRHKRIIYTVPPTPSEAQAAVEAHDILVQPHAAMLNGAPFLGLVDTRVDASVHYVPFDSFLTSNQIAADSALGYATIDRDLTLTKWSLCVYPTGANNAGNYWEIEIHDLTPQNNLVAALNTAQLSALQWGLLTTAVFVQPEVTIANTGLYIWAAKVGSPDPINFTPPIVAAETDSANP